ncbi:Cobalamin biosynthesis protein CbiG [hydrothermal vent metagenome]|uniref:Cobalamin biosynthesis protein CbiG n=1 Tax=hydrothermal vent metagenome TaxID=652676 RepID=A0A1W1CFU2_9ZZZZ
MKIAIVTINNPSLESAKKLLPILSSHQCTIFNKSNDEDGFIIYKKLDDILANAWENFDAILFIMATGAVIRKVAPYLKDKASDPAILIMTLDLKRVIPLISGHLGGANELSIEISDTISGCINFVTTASDQIKVLSFDMFAKKMGYKISNLKSLAEVSNRIINKELVQVVTYPAVQNRLKEFEGYRDENFKFISPDRLNLLDINIPTVYITPQKLNNSSLQLHPQKIVLGLGMNRDTSEIEIDLSVKRFCLEHSLDMEQIDLLASFEAKSDEIGLLEFAKNINKDIKFFSSEDINELEEKFSPSEATRFFNIKGVAEPASLLASEEKTLFLAKRIYGNVTIASSF